MISSLTKTEMNFERRKAVAHFVSESIKDILNSQIRIHAGWELLKNINVFKGKPELIGRQVSWCNGVIDTNRSEIEFHANNKIYIIKVPYRARYAQLRRIDFMYIHHIPFSSLKDIFIIADGRLVIYRGSKLEIANYR